MQLPVEGALPSLDGAIEWLNLDPLTTADLHGRVVVVDFWTYSCINWLRSLPYVRALAEKYGDQGLVTIGVHTPEFGFEHDVENVRRAASEMRVDYPIAIDSDYAVWRAFDNNYWPALYFVDAQGLIRHHHFGEGEYEESEAVIQSLRAEAGIGEIDRDLVSVDARGIEAAADWGSLQSPESYLGYERRRELRVSGWRSLQTSVTTTMLRRDYGSTAGPSRGIGPSSGRLRCSTGPTGRSCAAFTPAISISSVEPLRGEPPRDFVCLSTATPRVMLTGSMSTNRVSAPSRNRGSIS